MNNSEEYYKNKIVEALGTVAVDAYKDGFAKGMKLQQEMSRKDAENRACYLCKYFKGSNRDSNCERLAINVDDKFFCKYFDPFKLIDHHEAKLENVTLVGKNDCTDEYKSEINKTLGILGQ